MRKQSRLQTGRLEPLYPDKLSLVEGERKGRRRGKGGREGAVKEEKEISPPVISSWIYPCHNTKSEA